MTELLLERPPQSEVYGRSLSTMYRLGAAAVNRTFIEAVASPEADQARVEFYTSVEEGFGTDMELGGGLEVRDFDERPVIAGRVMSKDLKTAVSDMTKAGLICAKEKYAVESRSSKKDRRFQPQLIRSEWDHANAIAVDEMAQGKTDYNTRIVVSPFPEEAAVQSGDKYWQNIGYVPHLKRGFVQLYHIQDGELVTGSLSFDGSNKHQLREIFSQYGIEIPEGEVTDNWLQYAITATLSEEQAKALATSIADQAGEGGHKKTTNTVEVTRQYGAVMDQAFDESYIHACESLYRGYQTEGARGLIYRLADKAHHFNTRYATSLYKMRANENQFTDDDMAVLHELLVYSTIEMMRSLHLRRNVASYEATEIDNKVYPQLAYVRSIDPASFQNMLGNFGAEGARNKRTYSACGLSISLGEDNKETVGKDNFADGPQSAFGGTLDDKEKKHTSDKDDFGPLNFKCPRGHWNKRPPAKSPKDFLSHCKKCGVSLKC